MRKLLLAVVVIVAVVVLGGPFLMGQQAEKQVYKTVAFLNQNFNVNATVRDYKRSWLKSTADIEVDIVPKNISNMGMNNPLLSRQYKFSLKENIYHGPVVFHDGVHFAIGMADGKLVLDPTQQALLNAVFKDEKNRPSLNNQAVFTYMGGVNLSTAVPKFSVTQNNQTLIWEGLTGTWEFNRGFKHVGGNMTFNGMQVNAGPMMMNVKPITMNYNLTDRIGEIWTGRGTVNIPEITAKKGDAQAFALKDLNIVSNANSSSDNKLINYDTNIQLAKVMVNSEQYGPAALTTSFTNLDADALNALVKQGRAMQDNPNMPANLKAMSMMGLLPKLVAHGAMFEIKALSLQLPEGLVKANGRIEFPKVADGKNAMMALAKQTKGDFNMQMPVATTKALIMKSALRSVQQQQRLQQIIAHSQQGPNAGNNPQIVALSPEQIHTMAQQSADQKLQAMISKGYLKQDGDNYTVAIKFEGGQLTINGKPMMGPGMAPMAPMGPAAMPH